MLTLIKESSGVRDYTWGIVLIRRAGNSFLEEVKTELRSEGTERVNLAKTAEKWKWQI